MISRVQQQDIDLWEVWIEYDQFNPTHFGILYVLGEIVIDQDAMPPYIEKNFFDDGTHQLMLSIPARTKGPGRNKEVLYAEPIRDLSQYTSVCICAGDQIIAKFSEIEIMI